MFALASRATQPTVSAVYLLDALSTCLLIKIADFSFCLCKWSCIFWRWGEYLCVSSDHSNCLSEVTRWHSRSLISNS